MMRFELGRGTAYASVGGWINFNPTGAGVTLVDNGSGSNFYGYAYVSGINGGWIKFDCTDSSTCIKTDWRNTTHRASTSEGGGNSGRSGGGLYVPPEGTPPSSTLLPQDAYQNFPGQSNIGHETNLIGEGDNTTTNEQLFFNPYEEGKNINNSSDLLEGSSQSIKNNNCPNIKNLSCLWKNKYFLVLFPITILMLLILIGLHLWRKFYK